MSHLGYLLAAAEVHVDLPIPTWGYAVIAFSVFLILAGVTFSYRDVANRQTRKVNKDAAAHASAAGASTHHDGHAHAEESH